jgi:hypothetical protein
MNTFIAISIYVISGLCVISLVFNKIIPNIPILKDLVKDPKKSICKFLCSLSHFLSFLFKKKENKTPLTQKEYFEQFGISTEDPTTGDYIPVSSNNMKLLKAAYQKAWECRNFEIDKSWTRSAYFWGFIALIFTGYVALATANQKPHVDIEELKYLSLYVILLGFLFSVGWWLVIKGSKAWQENWEKHIDALEDLISGPLYKTVFCPIRPRYYSVSKINEVMAIVTIIVWVGLLIQFFLEYKLYLPFFDPGWKEKIIWPVTMPLFIASIFFIVLVFGYPISGYHLSKDSLKELKEQKLKGAFIRRDKKESNQ